jgi:hypothetical protein
MFLFESGNAIHGSFIIDNNNSSFGIRMGWSSSQIPCGMLSIVPPFFSSSFSKHPEVLEWVYTIAKRQADNLHKCNMQQKVE